MTNEKIEEMRLDLTDMKEKMQLIDTVCQHNYIYVLTGFDIEGHRLIEKVDGVVYGCDERLGVPAILHCCEQTWNPDKKAMHTFHDYYALTDYYVPQSDADLKISYSSWFHNYYWALTEEELLVRADD